MSMESRPESPRRTLSHELTPVILLVSMVTLLVGILGLGFVMYERIATLEKNLKDSLKEEISEVNEDIQALDGRIAEDIQALDGKIAEARQDIQALDGKFTQMQITFNGRLDEIERQVARSTFVAVPDTGADGSFIVRFEKLMEGRFPTMEEFEALEAQIKALQERRVQ